LHRIFRHLRIVLRTESAIAEVRLRMLARRSTLFAFAGLIAVFGLGMLNAAAFLALQTLWGPVWAAAAAALGDFVVALIIAGIALALRTSPELNTAIELRQAALDGLEEEFRSVPGVARGPVDSILPAILGPLLTGIIQALRKTKSSQQ